MRTLNISEQLEGSAKEFFDKNLALKQKIKNTEEYRQILAFCQSSSTNIYFKGYYDKLDSAFDYHIFRQRLKDNSTYRSELSQTKVVFLHRGLVWNENYELSYHIINIFNVYCGFVAEAIIQKALDNEGLSTKATKHLDNKYKIDILVEDKLPLQMKNLSFLCDSGCEGRISQYKTAKAHRKYGSLRFLFYKVSESAIIDIYSINGDTIPFVSTLNGFSAVGAKAKGFYEAIEDIKAVAIA